VLRECFSRVETAKDLDGALAAYEAIRKPRCERTQQIANGKADKFVLPVGPEQEARETKFKDIMEMHEKELRETGREIGRVIRMCWNY